MKDIWGDVLEFRLYILVLISVVLYVLSLFFPAFTTDSSYQGFSAVLNDYMGWYVLMIGWAAVLDNCIAWFANPLFGLSVLMLLCGQTSKVTRNLSYGSFILALSSFFYSSLWADGGPRERIVEYQAGFWLWLSAMFGVAFCAMLSRDNMY
ncbi:hypothetical protein Y5W_02677 [Alcanivorax sp. 521-1]|uniref:Transmembrane protein n=1 Tax=Alloalcanivorax profundimaris TaxID=2735259 RepID=A0ABS0ATE5_9GAMM|nr:hypothetical protein [Alloalcanivorax profundimaris]MBF5057383.1 hypothetical protein [Alloalcanivorax profundimaris]